MLPLGDPLKALSRERRIAEGDLVIVYERHDQMKAVRVTAGGELQNRFGVFRHSDWIGRPFGCRTLSSKGGGGFVHLLFPTPELWTLVLSHRTQILYLADISLVLTFLELSPSSLVLESGTGSGSLSTSLARAVAPSGHVYTFDFHAQRAASARDDFELNGMSSLITVGVRDIQGEGFPDEFSGRADAVFLDLPQPWLAIPSAAKMLKQDCVICSFSPCIEQVQRTCDALTLDFTDIRTLEVLLRTYEIQMVKVEVAGDNGNRPTSLPCKRKNSPCEDSNNGKHENAVNSRILARPCSEMRGHTGYLTFARAKVYS